MSTSGPSLTTPFPSPWSETQRQSRESSSCTTRWWKPMIMARCGSGSPVLPRHSRKYPSDVRRRKSCSTTVVPAMPFAGQVRVADTRSSSPPDARFTVPSSWNSTHARLAGTLNRQTLSASSRSSKPGNFFTVSRPLTSRNVTDRTGFSMIFSVDGTSLVLRTERTSAVASRPATSDSGGNTTPSSSEYDSVAWLNAMVVARRPASMRAVFLCASRSVVAKGTGISPLSSALNTVSPIHSFAPLTIRPSSSSTANTCPAASRRSVARRRPLRTSARLATPCPEHSTT